MTIMDHTDRDLFLDAKVLIGIQRLQALWRGHRTRKKLLETREEFKLIFTQIEENFNGVQDVKLFIQWPRMCLCKPKFVKNTENSSAVNILNCSIGSPEVQLLDNTNIDLDSDLLDSNTDPMLRNVDGNQLIIEYENPLSSNVCNFGTQTESFNKQLFSSTQTRRSSLPINLLDMTQDSINSLTNDNEKMSGLQNCPSIRSPPPGSTQLGSLSLGPSSPVRCSTPVNMTLNVEDVNDVNEQKFSKGTYGKNTKNKSSLETRNAGHNAHNILTESWLSEKSFSTVGSIIVSDYDNNGMTRDNLFKAKEDLTLELLWIKQAIKSRKSYLKMKNERT